jgi:multiple sugar transport system ATP-binding protein
MTLANRIVIMDGGVLQQAGTPVEVFHEPVNTFVAGFIGSPAMNFVSGEVGEDAGRLVFRGEGVVLPLPDDLRRHLADDRKLQSGFRPQHLEVVTDAASGDPRYLMDGTVEFVEHMGVEKFLHVGVSGQRLIARAEGTLAVEPGDRIRLRVPPERVHLFNAAGHNVRFA